MVKVTMSNYSENKCILAQNCDMIFLFLYEHLKSTIVLNKEVYVMDGAYSSFKCRHEP